MIIVHFISDVLLRCLESLERKASDGSDQQETSAALKEVECFLKLHTQWCIG